MNAIGIAVAIGALSFFTDHLTSKNSYKDCMDLTVQIPHLAHHIFMVFITIAWLSRDPRIVTAGLFALLFMLGCWNIHKTGDCFLTEWTNKKCKLPETRRLRNIFFTVTGKKPEDATLKAWVTSMFLLAFVYVARLQMLLRTDI